MRKGLSKKIRFEVFKRDKFTCQYCGCSAPEVILEVDHIKPVAKGGDNTIFNLVTSCRNCNQGKSDRELDDFSHAKKLKVTLDENQERINQINLMHEWKMSMISADDTLISNFITYFESLFHCQVTEKGKVSFSKLLKFDPDIVYESIDIAHKQYFKTRNHHEAIHALSKVSGIAYNLTTIKEKPYHMLVVNMCNYLKSERFSDSTYSSWKDCYRDMDECIRDGVSVDELQHAIKRCTSWEDVNSTIGYLHYNAVRGT